MSKKTSIKPAVSKIKNSKSCRNELSAQRIIEKELISQKKFSESLINSSVDGIFAYDDNYKLITWNLAMEYITGLSSEKTIGKNIFTLFPFFRKIGEDILMQKALDGKSVISKGKKYTISKSSREGFFEAHYSPLFNEIGDVVGGLAIIRDVTSRIKIEQELLSNQQKIAHLASFPQLNSNPICEVDLNGNLTYANQAIIDLFPDLKQKGLNHPWFVKFKKLPKNLVKEKKFDHEIQIGNKYFAQTMQFVPSANSTRIYAIEISKRKKEEEKVRQLAIILENVNDAVISIDENLKITSWNHQAEEMYGWKKEEVLDQSIKKIIKSKKEQTIQSFIEIINKTDQDGRWGGDLTHYRKDGQEIQVWASFSVLKDANSTKTSYIIALRDISLRKKLEEDLKKSQIQLENRVSERTIELANSYQKLKKESEERILIQNKLDIDNALLKIHVQSHTRQRYLDRVLKLIKNWTGCNYAGIRVLSDDGGIPYESYYGFSKEFWQSENMLNVKRDNCACIRVIKGKPEPQDKKTMTTAGSFRLCNSLEFISGLTKKEQSRFRGVCIRTGFVSIAVIPIRYDRKTYGAIHLADKKSDKVPLETVEFIESITPLIGEGMSKFESQETLKKNYELLERFFDNTNFMVAYLDKNFNFIRVNQSYAKAAGLAESDFVGKNHFELFPDKENEQIFKEVLSNGETYSVYNKSFRYPNQPDKGLTYWDWTLQPIRNKTGQIIELLLCLVDVTEKTKASQKLLESYKYLGIVNRQLSILTNFNKSGDIKNPKNVAEFIVNTALKLSGAKEVLLYRFNKEGRFFELSFQSDKSNMTKIQLLFEDDWPYLRDLIERPQRIQINPKENDLRILNADSNLKYFVILPLVSAKSLEGFLLLGFVDRDSVSTQELDFFEAFAYQASFSLQNF